MLNDEVKRMFNAQVKVKTDVLLIERLTKIKRKKRRFIKSSFTAAFLLVYKSRIKFWYKN